MTITPASVRATTFAAASRLRRGYDADQVDAFVERIAVRLEQGEGLSSNDVYRADFGRSGIGGRGYAEADVDRFLELVHVELSRLEDAWGHETAAASDEGAGREAEPEPSSADPDANPGEADGSPVAGEAPAPVSSVDPDRPDDDLGEAPGDAPRPGAPS
jgi:DivIVA domain-containing protein